MILNQWFKNTFQIFSVATLVIWSSIGTVYAEQRDIEQIRWKSEAQVRSILGNPKSIQGPIGTHASYTLWKYDDFTVAFANNRAFHMFEHSSLQKFVLDEDR